jgi:hypothetical protein
MAFSTTTLVLDQAFDAIGMKHAFQATDESGKLRLLVCTVRCTYAHGIIFFPTAAIKSILIRNSVACTRFG